MMLYFKLGAAALVAVVLWFGYHAIKDSGRQQERSERAAEVQKRLNDATIADTAVTRCLANPACRLSDDGFRRD